MNTYSVEMPDGSVIDDVPEGTTDDQLMAEWNRLKSFDQGQQGLPQGSLLTPEEQLKGEFGQAFGLPPEQIDFGNSAGQGMRLALGAASDNPAEREAFIRQQYPGANVQQRGDYFGVQQQPGTPPVFMNPPGMDWGDVTEFVGNVGPSVAGGLAGTAAGVASAPGGPVAPLVGGAVGVAASEGAKELAQSFVGSQRETLPEFGTRAAIGAGMEFLPGLAVPAKAAWRKLAGSGGDALASTLAGGNAKDLEGLTQALKDSGELTLPDLMLFQKSDNPLLRKVATQSRQFSDVAKQRYLDQLNQLGEVARTAAPGAGQPLSADEIVQEGLAEYHRRARGKVAPEMDTQVAGNNLIGGVRGGLDSRKAEMSQAYKDLDEVYKAEEPVFNLTKTVELAQPRKVNLADVEGNPINVAAAPTSELAGIMTDISKLGPVQENFEGVKEIRSRLGSLLELPPVKLAESGIDIGQVKRLYGQLSEDMMTNTGSRAFEDAARAAGQTAKRYYDVYDVTQIKDAINKADAGQLNHLYKSIADDPASLETGFTDVLSLAKPSNIREFRGGITRSILSADDPLAALQKWKRESGDGYEWLMRDPSVKDMTEQMVRARKEMDNSFFRKAWEQDTMRSGFAGEALQQEATDAASSRNFLKEMGGKGSEGHEAVRTAIWENAINNSRAFNEAGGVEALDPKLLRKEIKKMKDNRWWSEILTVQDKAKLEGLEGYAETSWQKGSGSDGLMMAGLVGKLRSSQVGAAVAEISSSRWIARAMMSEKWNKNALLNAAKRAGNAQTKQAFSGRWPRAVATVIANTAEMGKILEEEEQLKAP